MTAQSACAACGAVSVLRFLERHHDRIGGKDYRIVLCPECGVVFSEPREAVGPEWYEMAAPIRGQEFVSRPEKDWRFRQFLGENLPPGKILDVGCGDGGFLRLAKERGWAVCGFDYDRRMVEEARALGLEDVSAEEFESFCRLRSEGEFDAITMFDVLEHTPEPALFINRLRRLLKPGGHIAITLPNASRVLPLAREEHDYPPHHFSRWTPSALRGFLERNGFAVLSQRISPLRLAYLVDHLFFYVVMSRLLPLARRLLFGQESAGRTISELYRARPARGPLGRAFKDKLRRHQIVMTFKGLMKAILYPVAGAMAVYYLATRRDCGDCLYTLAQRGG